MHAYRWLLWFCLTAALACGARSPMPPTTKAPVGISAGPMVGHGAHHEVGIWLRTEQPAEVAIRYWPLDDPTAISKTVRQMTGGGDGHIAIIRVEELPAGTKFGFGVEVNGRPIERGYPMTFQTQVIWHRRAPAPDFVVAFGSCAYMNDPLYEPEHEKYGGEPGIFESIRATQPDLMLWLGDNIYLRPVDWSTRGGFYRRYARDRALPELQSLLANTHHYATWDDHDYGPNNSDRSFSLKGVALEAFIDNWVNPSYGLPQLPGVFGQFTWNDIDFFLTDNRYHRAPSRAPTGPDKHQLGPAQLEWLLDALTSSKAPFKVVVSGGQVLSPFDRFEGYAQHPDERDALIAGIADRRIEGVVFLSGDRHIGELVRVQLEGLYPLYDYTSSPLTAGMATADVGERDSPVRVPDTLIESTRTFGLLRFTGPKADRRMRMEAYDTAGALLWKHDIAANDLKFPKAD